jgi:sporulation protein YlmC with PRC-barrel domain
MKYSELINQEVYCEGLQLGKITDVIIDGEEWKVTHLEMKLRKEAAKELLGAKTSFKNLLAISAVGPASKCCMSESGIDL